MPNHRFHGVAVAAAGIGATGLDGFGMWIAVGMTLQVCSCTCRGVSNEFFLLPTEQRDAEFQKYDIETQYKIYICGQQREPPMLELSSPFAQEGGRIVPLLKMKLESTDNDLRIRDIVRLFREMNDLGTYDVAANKSLMEELRSKVSGMKDPAWQKITEKMLLEIREKSPTTSKLRNREARPAVTSR